MVPKCTILIGLYRKIGHGPGHPLLAFGQFTLKLDFAMPLTERLFNTHLRREDFFDKLFFGKVYA